MEWKWSYHKWCCWCYRFGGVVVKLCSCNLDAGLVVHSFGFYYCSISGPRRVRVCVSFMHVSLFLFILCYAWNIFLNISFTCTSLITSFAMPIPILFGFLNGMFAIFVNIDPIDKFFSMFFMTKFPFRINAQCMLAAVWYRTSPSAPFPFTSKLLPNNSFNEFYKSIFHSWFAAIFIPAERSGCVGISDVHCPCVNSCECFRLFYTLWSYFNKRFCSLLIYVLRLRFFHLMS